MPEGCVHVVYPQGDVSHAVAVTGNVLGDGAVGSQPGGEDEGRVPLGEGVAGPVPDACFGASVGEELEAEGLLVEVGGLVGVADPELNVVDGPDRQEVLHSWLRSWSQTNGHGTPPRPLLPYNH